MLDFGEMTELIRSKFVCEGWFVELKKVIEVEGRIVGFKEGLEDEVKPAENAPSTLANTGFSSDCKISRNVFSHDKRLIGLAVASLV